MKYDPNYSYGFNDDDDGDQEEGDDYSMGSDDYGGDDAQDEEDDDDDSWKVSRAAVRLIEAASSDVDLLQESNPRDTPNSFHKEGL